jgi:single-stranded-DNA-specific exonuclease
LAAPPRFIKDKHVRMKLGAGRKNGGEARSSSGNGGWRNAVVYDAMGWRLGESARQAELIAGDSLDIAFTLDQNHHPEFGGMELSLLDFRKV